MSSIALDFHAVALPVIRSDELGNWIEEPCLLALSAYMPSVKSDGVVSMSFNDSLHWES